jgi:DNA-binding transcriptional MocR family regulator
MDYHDYRDAIFASELTSNAKLLALAISYHYNWKDQKWAWPSNRTLAKETSLSIRTVVRAKSELVSTGHLVSQRRFNDSNVYMPILPSQSGVYPSSDSLTNNELNNEINNELYVSDETSTFTLLSVEREEELRKTMSW